MRMLLRTIFYSIFGFIGLFVLVWLGAHLFTVNSQWARKWLDAVPPSALASDNPWGVSTGIRRPQTAQAFMLAGRAGIGYVRFSVGQGRVQPKKSAWNDTVWTQVMAGAAANGLMPLVQIGWPPRWNSSAPPEVPDEDAIFYPPKDEQAWRAFVARFVGQYPDVLYAAKVFWFKLHDSDAEPGARTFGLLDFNAQKKPVYDAYRDLIRCQNPFGVMLPSRLVRSSQGMQIAKALGVVYLRPSAIFLDEWNGTCPECDIALRAGLQLVLTVRNNGRGQATSPPSDLATYQRTLGQVLDTYRPVVLVVENEENSALFYTGTPEEYAAELKAACQVAHAKGIPCTNGGLVSALVALLVYDHYLSSGDSAAAQDFAARVFTPDLQ